VHVPRGTPPVPGDEVLLDEDDISVEGLTVLVIDDEPAIRYALKGLLNAWGCDCLAAGGGEEAQASLDQCGRAPDAILCDYRFAGETGVEVIARLRAAAKASIPALIVTGDVTADRLVDIARHELPVIHKPVNPAQLRRWLGQVRADSRA
jgi:CheY-like chemotaxis protein